MAAQYTIMTKNYTIPLPVQFITRMQNQLGPSASDFFRSLDTESPVSVRIHPAKWKNNRKYKPVPWCSTGIYLEKRPSFTLDPWFHSGAYYVQEPGSMFLEQAFAVSNGITPRLILDLCGAPGGKSTHLLSLMSPDDFLVSNEVIRSRASILQENIQKWGYSNVAVTSNDPRDFAKLRDLFDIVVVDAPCSGEGLFRKDRASVDEWSESNTQLCAARQRRILAEAWACLKPGGFLIYSTCTYNTAENEENLAWISGLNNAVSLPLKTEEDWNIVSINTQQITGYQLFPHLTPAEGFFTGVLQKRGPTHSFRLPGNNQKRWSLPEIKQAESLKRWIIGAQRQDFLRNGDDLCHLPAKWHSLVFLLASRLNLLQAGIPAATAKGDRLIPHPALAHATELDRTAFQEIDLSLKDALKYLQRDSLHLPGMQPGWILTSFRGIPLGWMNHLGNRTNNYFPQERRIRMQIPDLPLLWHQDD